MKPILTVVHIYLFIFLFNKYMQDDAYSASVESTSFFFFTTKIFCRNFRFIFASDLYFLAIN